MNPQTAEILESIYSRYHKPQYLGLDPVQYVREFDRPADKEIAGLLASALAYGRVEIIRLSVRKVFGITGKNLLDFVCSTSLPHKRKMLRGVKHRFNDGVDLALLFECARQAIVTYGSLEGLFLNGLKPHHCTIKQPLNEFVQTMRNWAIKTRADNEKTFNYFFPFPKDGSACKRLNMYLRWMVRGDDGIDCGIWGSVKPSTLVIPVDTHVSQLAVRLHLTARKTADWRMAEEITDELKKINPSDPVKYDFSLCRAGMEDFRNMRVRTMEKRK
jgi:uncharacterized protein (TIGR02757 family)